MKQVVLLLLCFLAGCLHARHKGLYDESREFTLPKDVGEKDSSVLLEEAYPTLTRRFYGAGPSSRGGGDYGSPFNMDHEAVVGDHGESFGDTESFTSMSEHGVGSYMGGGRSHYAAHTPYSDHGVVISDSVAKKIGLYDKDYLKKLGLDSKDVVENAGSGDEDIPKEDANKEKERMKKIGVEEYRNGKHKDDKKQVAKVKDVFSKETDTAAGINYNKNGVMVDKKLAEKLGLYDKDYLKKLGIWEEKEKEEENEKKARRKKAKSGKAKKRTLAELPDDASSGSEEGSAETENAEFLEFESTHTKRDEVPGVSRQLSRATSSPMTMSAPGGSYATNLGTATGLGASKHRMAGSVRSLESSEGGMDTSENTAGMPMMSGPTSMGGIGNPMPESFSQGGENGEAGQAMDPQMEAHNMGEGMGGNGMMAHGMMGNGEMMGNGGNMGSNGGSMMGNGASMMGNEGNMMNNGGMMSHGMEGNSMMAGHHGMASNAAMLGNSDEKGISAAMAEQDKADADATAQRVGNFMETRDQNDMSHEGIMSGGRHMMGGFNQGNSTEGGMMGGGGGEGGMMNSTDGGPANEGGSESYEDSEGGEEGDDGDKHTAGATRTPDDADDMNHDIADQVIKNRHQHENVIHGTPCVDCHTTGPIGHGAVISGSEAKKIGLNDESYLKRLGIKECKIKGPGFSEGNHGGAISDEWAKKLDGFDKKYLQQLGIPEEALEGNSASRDCKFVERIAEVMQGTSAGNMKTDITATNAPPDAVKNDPDKKDDGTVGEETEKAASTGNTKKSDDDLMKVEVEFKKPKVKEVSPVKETPVAAGEKAVDASTKKKKVEANESRSVKKDEKKAKAPPAVEAKEKEEPSEETNKATEDVKSAAEPPLPNVESKAIKAEQKEAAGTKAESVKETAPSEDNGSGLETLHSRDDTIKHLSEEKAIVCHEIDPDKNSKLGTIHENCTVRTPSNATEDTSNSTTATAATATSSAGKTNQVKNGAASKRHNQPLVDENERKANLRKRVSQLKRSLPKKLYASAPGTTALAGLKRHHLRHRVHTKSSIQKKVRRRGRRHHHK